jgi:hypothetical protein
MPRSLVSGILFIGTFLLFLTNYDGSWIRDDYATIVNNPNIQSVRQLPQLWSASIQQSTDGEIKSDMYRPVLMSLLAIERGLFGAQPRAMHLFNNAIHAMNVVLLFLLAALFLNTFWAAFAALLFAVHPLVTEGVNWLSAASDPWMATFALLFALLVLRADLSALWSLLGTVLLIWLGLFTRESFILVPFFILGIALIMSEGQQRRRLLQMLMVAFVSIAGGLWWRGQIVALPALSLDKLDLPIHFAALLYRFSTLLINPSDLDFVNIYEMPAAHSVMVVSSWFFFILLLGWWIIRGRHDPVLGMGAGLFIAPLLPTALALPMVGSISERYFYLSMAGAGLMIAGLLAQIKSPRSKKWVIVGGTIWLVLLTMITVVRNRQWQNSVRLYQSSIDRNANNYMAHYLLAWHFLRLGDRQHEIECYEAALRANPQHLSSLNNLAIRYIEQAQWSAAKALLDRALKIDPQRSKTLFNIGYYFQMRHQGKEAKLWYERALAIDPKNQKARQALMRF